MERWFDFVLSRYSFHPNLIPSEKVSMSLDFSHVSEKQIMKEYFFLMYGEGPIQ